MNKFIINSSPFLKYIEGVALDHFHKLKPSTTAMVQFHSHLSHESDQDAKTTATHIHIILESIISKGFVSSLLTTMWYHKYGCVNKYHCAYCIHLISYLALEFCIIISRDVVAPGHGKDVFDGMNYREKQILKLTMINLLGPELIFDDPNFYKLMQVYENEEYQAVSLATKSQCVFYLIHNGYTNNNNTLTYHIENIKMSTCIGIIGSFLIAKLNLNSTKREE